MVPCAGDVKHTTHGIGAYNCDLLDQCLVVAYSMLDNSITCKQVCLCVSATMGTARASLGVSAGVDVDGDMDMDAEAMIIKLHVAGEGG